MSVYVDPIVKWPTAIRCFKPGSCHMFADTLEELHAMARRIGLKREWFQGARRPHYDLTIGRRAKAVELGAIELGTTEAGRKMRELFGRPEIHLNTRGCRKPMDAKTADALGQLFEVAYEREAAKQAAEKNNAAG